MLDRLKKSKHSLLKPVQEETKSLIDFITYHGDTFVDKKNVTLENLFEYFDEKSSNWIHVCGSHNIEVVQDICDHFSLHPLLIEDIISSNQRAKLDDYKDYLFITMQIITYNPYKKAVQAEQASLILGKNYVLSFVETDQTIFESVKHRLKNEKCRIRDLGPDDLCYNLIDCLVDRQFETLERVDEQLEYLEEDLINHPKSRTVQKIQSAKREILLLRRAVWPTREVLSLLRRLDTPLIQEHTKLYIQDIYDRTIQAIDTIESFRDMASGMFDIYLSNINLRMNDIMKELTIVSTIFVPLTFIASIYGMNFDYMPELHMRWGYHLTIGIMLSVATGMLLFFRHKKWF